MIAKLDNGNIFKDEEKLLLNKQQKYLGVLGALSHI